jgi:hypothetical protein
MITDNTVLWPLISMIVVVVVSFTTVFLWLRYQWGYWPWRRSAPILGEEETEWLEDSHSGG